MATADPSATPKRDADTARERTIPGNASRGTLTRNPRPNACCPLELKWGAHEETIIIHNVYNPVPSLEPTNSAITALQGVLGRWKDAEQIVVSDFNLHHTYLGGLRVETPDPEAEEALQLIEEYQLGLLYEPGTTTFRVRDTETTIDLSLATPSLQDSLIRCRPRDDLDHDSDHIPLETVLAKPSRNRTISERRSWERTDREKLYVRSSRHMPTTTGLITEEDIDSATKGIVSAILTAVRGSTPKSRISPQSTPGWTRECKEAQQLA
ncbi:hypothetical protein CBS147353_11474 [Aspergillus niger]|nr:hypothetical protein CBS147353_11474 [Aspergillus niger]